MLGRALVKIQPVRSRRFRVHLDSCRNLEPRSLEAEGQPATTTEQIEDPWPPAGCKARQLLLSDCGSHHLTASAGTSPADITSPNRSCMPAHIFRIRNSLILRGYWLRGTHQSYLMRL